jgi:uncharacterized protein (TIGR00730 family)
MSSSNQIKNVVIFSGGTEGDGAYVTLANELGKSLAKNGFTVVNGGGPGLMDIVAKGAFEEGGKVIGVHFEFEGRTPSKYNTETLKYKELFPRQQKVISLADAFVVLPGGLGTLYELVEVIAKKYLSEIGSDVPVILISEEFWDPFLKLTDLQKKRKFIGEKVINSFKVVNTIDEVLMELKQKPEIEQMNTYLHVTTKVIADAAIENPACARDAILWEATRRMGELYEKAYLEWLEETIHTIESKL